MRRLTKIGVLSFLALAFVVCLTMGAGSLRAKADGTVEYSYSKSGVTVTCGNQRRWERCRA